MLQSTLQQRLGDTPMTNILSTKRAQLMADVAQELIDRAAEPFGIRVVDVRFKGRSTCRRRTAKRSIPRCAASAPRKRPASVPMARAGRVEVKAEADKERVVELAEARRQAAVLRGEGEAEATRIYNEAFGKDASFFDFYRSLQAMREG